MFYHSALVYSMVDITVRTIDELGFVSLLVIVSAIINALIYGQFAVLTEELKKNTNEFLENFDNVNAVMNAEQLPDHIKE